MSMCSPRVRSSIGDGTANGSVHLQDAGFQGLLARKREHALYEQGTSLGQLIDLLDHGRDFRITSDGGRGELGHANNDGQNIIEIMGDAAG